MIESIRVATEYLDSKDKVLLVTGDIPLITEEAILDFCIVAKRCRADIYYPVVRRDQREQISRRAAHVYASQRGRLYRRQPGAFATGDSRSMP